MSTAARTRPAALTVKPENIPPELTSRPRWVLWRYECRKRKWTKPPYTPAGGLASSTDPDTWSSFDAVLAAYRAGGWDGIGFIHQPEDNLVGGDVDHCRDPLTGALTGEDAKALRELDTYTEVSPSGTGIRAYAFGRKPGPKCKRRGFELYDGLTAEGKPGGRYLTLTGHRLADSPAEVQFRKEQIDKLYRQIWPDKDEQTKPPVTPGGASMSDDEILMRASSGKNGEKFQKLFNGDTSGHGGDDSAADLALCNMLRFWSGRDAGTVDRLFRRSKLFRAKWDERRGESTYGERTVAEAMTGDVYNPQHKKQRGAAFVGGECGDATPTAPAPGYPLPLKGESWTDPHRLARLFIANRLTPAREQTVLQWRDEWHAWDCGAWRPWPDTDLDAAVMAHCREVFVSDLANRRAAAVNAALEAAEGTGKDPKAVKEPGIPPVTTKLRTDVKANLAGEVNFADLGSDPPFWLAGSNPQDPNHVIAAPNGLFLIGDIAQGKPAFSPPTPRFFTPNALPFEVPTGEQPAPALWLKCLDQWFSGDTRSILGLQEWLGYLLSAETNLQKVLMLVGPQRSGKGTVLSVLTDLVGAGNVASTTFAALGENFGLESLLGKRVAVVPDARLSKSGRTEVSAVVERLLSISGDDAQSVNRKNRRRITTRIKARFVLASNEVPNLPDASGALASRFHILSLPNTFLGKEDTDLKAKLRAELPAILAWAAKGYVRLSCQKSFTQNDAAAQYQRELQDLSSPVKAFVAERCRTGGDQQVRIAELFESWKQWNEVRNSPPGHEGTFGRDIHAAFPQIRVSQPRIEGVKVRFYNGIGLRPRPEWGDE